MATPRARARVREKQESLTSAGDLVAPLSKDFLRHLPHRRRAWLHHSTRRTDRYHAWLAPVPRRVGWRRAPERQKRTAPRERAAPVRALFAGRLVGVARLRAIVGDRLAGRGLD